jgi:hypoxanthine-guanine phosphoribosyltransferase
MATSFPGHLYGERVGDVFLSEEVIAARVRELGAEIAATTRTNRCCSSPSSKEPSSSWPIWPVPSICPWRWITWPSVPYVQEHREAGKKAIRFLKDLDRPVKDMNILLVEDIIDTGLTLHYILRSLQLRRPRSLEICTLLDRPQQRLADFPVKYVGFEVPDDFIVGYGFDDKQSFATSPTSPI